MESGAPLTSVMTYLSRVAPSSARVSTVTGRSCPEEKSTTAATAGPGVSVPSTEMLFANRLWARASMRTFVLANGTSSLYARTAGLKSGARRAPAGRTS